MAAERPINMYGAMDLSGLKAQAEAHAAPAAPGAAEPRGSGGYVTVGTDENFTSVIQLSQQVPVVVDLWAQWCEPCKTLSPLLERLVDEYAGRMVLVTVDVDANPQLAQAFQAQSIPMVLAIIGGRPAPLFTGAIPEAQLREALGSVLDAAAQMGITGAVGPLPSPDGAQETAADTGDLAADEQTEPPLSPTQQEAYAAIEAGDLDAAVAAYERALVQRPGDEESAAGLANVRLMQRLGTPPAELSGTDAVLAQADHLFAEQHADAAIAVLLDAWARASSEQREQLRARVLEYFLLLGPDSPVVAPARARLASLLY